MRKGIPVPIPTNPIERTAWVQAQLRLRGLSFAKIAERHGWHRNAVSMAMRLPSYPQERAIAAAIEVEIAALFPERYAPDGQRIHLVRGGN